MKVIQNKETYTCIREEGNCKLGSGKCTMCPYCRYKKCLEVGMSQDGKLVELSRCSMKHPSKFLTCIHQAQ